MIKEPLILYAILLYYIDIGSDVALGARYLSDGHLDWGLITLVFVLLPIARAVYLSIVDENQRRLFDSSYNVGWLFAITGSLPIANQLSANQFSPSGETPDATVIRNLSKSGY